MSATTHPLILARQWLDVGHGVALGVVISTWGSAPRPAGSLIVIRDDEVFEGSVSGGCVEGDVIMAGLDSLGDGHLRKLEFGVSNDDAWAAGLACGGQIRLAVLPLSDPAVADLIREAAELVDAGTPAVLRLDLDSGAPMLLSGSALDEAARQCLRQDTATLSSTGDSFDCPLNPPLELIIIGAVHIAQALAPMARQAGYSLRIIDPRGTFAQADRFSEVPVIVDWPDDVLTANPPGPRSAVVTLTHDPKLDDAALRIALTSPAFYIGCLGSRKTHAGRLDRLREAGFDETALDRIHGPVGLAIGARSPAEIAIATLAQITSVLRGTKP